MSCASHSHKTTMFTDDGDGFIPIPREPPMLMLPLHPCGEEDEAADAAAEHGCRLLSLKDGKALAFRDFPETFSKSRCVGSSHGWLVLLEETMSNPYLFDPFLGRRPLPLASIATLPCILGLSVAYNGEVSAFYKMSFGRWESTIFLPISELRDTIISKVVLSSEPSCNIWSNYDCLAVAIFGEDRRLAYCNVKDGDAGCWTELPCSGREYQDAIFYDGMLFAVSVGACIQVWDFSSKIPTRLSDFKSSFPKKSAETLGCLRGDGDAPCFAKSYLVEAEGKIWLILRFVGDFVNEDGVPISEGDLLIDYDTHPLVCPYRTLGFHVYELEWIRHELVELESIGDRAVFIGGNQSRAVLARDFAPGGCEGNSIYFTDDYWERVDEEELYGGHDNGIYSLKSGRVKEVCDVEKIKPPPFWVLP